MQKDIHCVYLLRGIDENLIGFSLDGWKIKSIHKNKLENENPTRENLYSLLEHCTDKINDIFFYDQLDADECFVENPCYFYLEKEVPEPPNIDAFNIQSIISTIRLFNTNSLGTVCQITYSQDSATLIKHDCDYTSYEFNTEVSNFKLLDNERNEIQEFYKKVVENKSENIKNMLDFFHESYRITNSYIAFILRVVILEMLIDGNAELNYRLSRSVAVLLGKTKEESFGIYDKCKKIYSQRSKYLHEGQTEKITPEYQLLALDYSRRVIANLIEIVNNNIGIKEIRDILHTSGLGDNPFNVKF